LDFAFAFDHGHLVHFDRFEQLVGKGEVWVRFRYRCGISEVFIIAIIP
jgi:hypothetical protein